MNTHEPDTKHRADDTSRHLKLQWFMKEADLLESEMDKRLERHAQSYYFHTLILTAVITAVATVADKAIGDQKMLAVLLCVFIFLPMITIPVSGMFFDDEQMRAVTDIHFHRHLAPKIRLVLAEGGQIDESLVRNSLAARFESLAAVNTELNLKLPFSRTAARTRRYVFAIPCVTAVISFGIIVWMHKQATLALPWHPWILGAVGAIDGFLFFRLIVMWYNAERIWEMIEKCKLPHPNRRELIG